MLDSYFDFVATGYSNYANYYTSTIKFIDEFLQDRIRKLIETSIDQVWSNSCSTTTTPQPTTSTERRTTESTPTEEEILPRVRYLFKSYL